ncbi:MAG: hypothetical protein AAB363_06365 [Planctomycetota bacterium]
MRNCECGGSAVALSAFLIHHYAFGYAPGFVVTLTEEEWLVRSLAGMVHSGEYLVRSWE